MNFAELVADQQSSIFDTLGEDASWAGLAEPVRVRLREEDRVPRFGDSRSIDRTLVMRVRRREVPAAAKGNVVEMVDGRLYKVIATPVLDAKGVWICEVEPTLP